MRPFVTLPRAFVLFLTLCIGLSTTACAQSDIEAPVVGTEATFDVATWNVEWFGSTSNGPSNESLQFNNVLEVMRDANIDLWAIQEVDDPAVFGDLVDNLGAPYEGILSTESSNFDYGFIYNSDVVRVRSSSHILQDFRSEYAGRPPFQMKAEITVDNQAFEATFIVLHNKCCSGNRDVERRDEATLRLYNQLTFLRSQEAVMVLGDFNDELFESITFGAPSPLRYFLEDEDDYRFVCQAVGERGEGTNYFRGEFGSDLDHILVSDQWFPYLVEGSSDRYDALLDVISGFQSNTSDHLPVYSRFSFGQATANETPNQASGFHVEQPYPNPAQSYTTIEVQVASPQPTSVIIYDMLGRAVQTLADATLSPGTHALRWNLDGVAPGLYIAESRSGSVVVHESIVVR